MTSLDDGITALLAEPTSRLVHCQLLDRMAEDGVEDVRRELVRLVIAHKANDGPRLLFAEFCERNAEPERGEFVRVQCELASRYPHWSGIPGTGTLGEGGPYHTLKIRERELLPVNGRSARAWFDGDWWGDWLCNVCSDLSVTIIHPSTGARFDPEPKMRYRFARGFVGDISHISAADWLAHGDIIVAEHPVESVTFAAMRPENIEQVFNLWSERFGKPPVGMSVLMCLEDMFPGIEFTLPPALAPLDLTPYLMGTHVSVTAELLMDSTLDTYSEALRTFTDSITRRMTEGNFGPAISPSIFIRPRTE